jgi:hypothetical protein
MKFAKSKSFGRFARTTEALCTHYTADHGDVTYLTKPKEKYGRQ